MKSSFSSSLIKRIAAGSLLFYALSGISSVLNYGFYPAIARFVSVSEYGEIQFLVSMFTQLAVGFVVLNILAIIIGTELKNRATQNKAIHSLNSIAGLVTLAIVIVGAEVLMTQRDALNLTSTPAVAALCASLLINVPFTVAIGRLQGNNQFVASGVIGMLGALFKLLFSLLFVFLGLGVMGAILGIFVGMAASLLLISIFTKRNNTIKAPKLLSKISFKKHISHLSFIKNRSVVAFIAITIITLLSAADSITSRVVLSSIDAGHYASVATVAKMILAATSPLMWLALPPAMKRDHKSVLRYVLVALAISSLASIIFNIAPSFFTQTIIGVDAQDYVSLLPLATLGMTLCAVAFIVLTAAVCLEKLQQVIITIILVVIAYFLSMITISSSINPLVAALYGQILGSLLIIVLLARSVLVAPKKPN